MLGLLACCYEVVKDGSDVDAVIQLAERVEANCRDLSGVGGYYAGVIDAELNQRKLAYTLSEHAADLNAVSQHL